MATDTATPESSEPQESEDTGEATALLPKSILAGKEFKPGDEVVLEIVHLYEDEVEVKYAKEKPGEDEYSAPAETGGTEMDKATAGLDQLAM